jgi:hypothetical protein
MMLNFNIFEEKQIISSRKNYTNTLETHIAK